MSTSYVSILLFAGLVGVQEKQQESPPDLSKLESALVRELFTEMRLGIYQRASFPKLDWSDIPSLMKLIENTDKLASFPNNPFSSQVQMSCSEGMAALWFIEGIRHGKGFFPSLNPSCSHFEDSAEVKAEETQRRVAALYKDWWLRVQMLKPSDAAKIDPLKGSGFSW